VPPYPPAHERERKARKHYADKPFYGDSWDWADLAVRCGAREVQVMGRPENGHVTVEVVASGACVKVFRRLADELCPDNIRLQVRRVTFIQDDEIGEVFRGVRVAGLRAMQE
jgi:hypothetical protein